jgi:predicted GNAT family acetyltransferase
VFYHTFVPVSHRGKGIAGVLIKEALDFAKKHDFRIKATCSAVQTYLRRHPEYISDQ